MATMVAPAATSGMPNASIDTAHEDMIVSFVPLLAAVALWLFGSFYCSVGVRRRAERTAREGEQKIKFETDWIAKGGWCREGTGECARNSVR